MSLTCRSWNGVEKVLHPVEQLALLFGILARFDEILQRSIGGAAGNQPFIFLQTPILSAWSDEVL